MDVPVKFNSFACVAAVLFATSQANVPSYINVCSRNDPKVEECIMNSIEVLRPKLVDGIPELGVPSFEPWKIPQEFVLIRGGDLKAIGTDVRVWGTSKFEIKSLKADIQKDKLRFEFEVTFPYMNIEGNYDVNLRILTIHIKGNGPFQSNNTDVDARAILNGVIVERNGKKYLEYKSADLTVDWSIGNIMLGNLFNGDKTLGTAVNNALNQNKRAVMDALKPRIEKMVAKHVMDVANKINNQFTYDELFPEK
ncbi:protein takeout [Halyomorpha halys]|uniref:protein takeout n=1 Tax=Halyomorpha halys TaxID=286706 RepID=UPI0006D5199E|nr:protein takeout-like [Halyomorpha halys]